MQRSPILKTKNVLRGLVGMLLAGPVAANPLSDAVATAQKAAPWQATVAVIKMDAQPNSPIITGCSISARILAIGKDDGTAPKPGDILTVSLPCMLDPSKTPPDSPILLQRDLAPGKHILLWPVAAGIFDALALR